MMKRTCLNSDLKLLESVFHPGRALFSIFNQFFFVAFDDDDDDDSGSGDDGGDIQDSDNDDDDG